MFEIWSFGELPYRGSTHSKVIMDINNGRRLEQPLGCPAVIYAVMLDCWNADLDQRLSFRRAYRRLVAAWDECAPAEERNYDMATADPLELSNYEVPAASMLHTPLPKEDIQSSLQALHKLAGSEQSLDAPLYDMGGDTGGGMATMRDAPRLQPAPHDDWQPGALYDNNMEGDAMEMTSLPSDHDEPDGGVLYDSAAQENGPLPPEEDEALYDNAPDGELANSPTPITPRSPGRVDYIELDLSKPGDKLGYQKVVINPAFLKEG